MLSERLSSFLAQAVVSIVSLIAHDNWGLVWLATAISGLVVLGAPQVVETLGWWRTKRAKHIPLN